MEELERLESPDDADSQWQAEFAIVKSCLIEIEDNVAHHNAVAQGIQVLDALLQRRIEYAQTCARVHVAGVEAGARAELEFMEAERQLAINCYVERILGAMDKRRNAVLQELEQALGDDFPAFMSSHGELLIDVPAVSTASLAERITAALPKVTQAQCEADLAQVLGAG